MYDDMNPKRKQWTIEETSNLIEIYREHENLWNPKSFNFKNRVKKFSSLKQIASTFSTTVQEVERKIKNLNTQYRRERRKKKSGLGHAFEPKWFGYTAMSFLQGVKKTRKSSQIGFRSQEADSSSDSIEAYATVTNIEKENEESEIEEENSISKIHFAEVEMETAENQEPENKNIKQEAIEIEDNRTNKANLEIRTKTVKSNIKNLTTNDEGKKVSEDVLSIIKTVFQGSGNREQREQRERDEFQVYGELIAHKIRNLRTEYSKATVQHLINNILYDAHVGKHDFPPQAQPPTCKCTSVVQSGNQNQSTTSNP